MSERSNVTADYAALRHAGFGPADTMLRLELDCRMARRIEELFLKTRSNGGHCSKMQPRANHNRHVFQVIKAGGYFPALPFH
jgi:hypothetical protein